MTFYIQEHAKGPFHVESDSNCEVMLCGLFISADSKLARIQSKWGPRKCPDCWMWTEHIRRIRSLGPSRQ